MDEFRSDHTRLGESWEGCLPPISMEKRAFDRRIISPYGRALNSRARSWAALLVLIAVRFASRGVNSTGVHLLY